MKRIHLIVSALLLGGSAAFAQGQLDAYRYAQTDLLGTARYMSMGGAFGALGGDISVLGTNPGGLAIYHSSEVVTTLDLSHAATKTNMNGLTGTAGRTPFTFNNLAYVGFFPTGNDHGLVGWNLGISYNRLKDFNRSYYSHDTGDGMSSLSDYTAERAAGYSSDVLGGDNAYYGNDFLPVLGYQSGMIDQMSGADKTYGSTLGSTQNGTWVNYPFTGRNLAVRERGSIDQYNFALGFNVSNRLFFGASLAVTDMNYNYHSYYEEDFGGTLGDGSTPYLTLDNYLKTSGTGYAVNVGAIFRPVDFLRIGVAYNSPTWYKMTDTYDARAEVNTGYWSDMEWAETPTNASSDYNYRTPDRWIFSAAAIIGQSGILSVDYELSNYKNMHLGDTDGDDSSFGTVNDDIHNNFNTTGTLRVGGEWRATPQFSIRAGYAQIGNPFSSSLKNGHTEVFPVGTIPNYTLEHGISNYTFGLGYRFTPNFYMDLACVLKYQKEDLYYMPNIPAADTQMNSAIISDPASLKTNTLRFALTLGYKF
jgi:long-subunit fatty acid transport protein